MMISITREDLPEETELLGYLSESSEDCDEEAFARRCAAIEPPVTLQTSFSKTIIVAGLPIVSSEKYELFSKAIRAIIIQTLKQKRVEFSDTFKIEILRDENGSTYGFALITFVDSFQAETACKCLSKMHFDKNNVMHAIKFDDLDDILKRDHSNITIPSTSFFTRCDNRWWLEDRRARQQFVLRYQNNTEIYLYDPIDRQPVLVYDGERAREGKRVWTDYGVEWSPMGSYLVTFHRLGVALWAGSNWDKKVRLEHKAVKCIQFCPNEEYLLTWDGSPADTRYDKAVRIWRLMGGELLRAFPTPVASPSGGDYPYFLWSPKSDFIASCSDKELFVYETNTMNHIEDPNTGKKTSLKYPLQLFDWSPSDNIISIWIPERGDTPGRLLLVSIPSRKELAIKNVFNVKEASIYWQPKGDYVCLKTLVVRKTGKKGKTEYTQLEIFRMRERNIPVDTIHIEGVLVKLFEWEPSNRFAVVVYDEITRSQILRFYQVGSTQTELVCSYSLGVQMEMIKWSPIGSYFVVVGTAGSLSFCQLNNENKFDILAKDEHFMLNHIQWDPTGRYVATALQTKLNECGYKYSTEAGYILWSFQGRKLFCNPKESFYQFLWRPQSQPLLPSDVLEEIPKKLKDYSKKYDAEDEDLRNMKRDAFLSERNAIDMEFDFVINAISAWKASHPKYVKWQTFYQNLLDSFTWEEHEEITEIEIDVRQEVVA